MHSNHSQTMVLRAILLFTLTFTVLTAPGCGFLPSERAHAEAVKVGTIEAYQDYLAKYPDALGSNSVKRRLDALLAERERAQEQARLAALARAAAEKHGAAAWNDGNYSEALRLAKVALAQGDPKANFVLAIIYWNGQGVKPDYELAVTHMKASGEADLSSVMQSAIECASKSSITPALEVPRGGMQMVNDGTCVRIGLNPTYIK